MNKFKNIVFCHIEKSGGTSLQYLLRNNFNGYVTMSPALFTRDENKQKILTAQTFKKFKRLHPLCNGLGGHRVKLYENYFDGNHTFKFTFLRNPVKRYISHFNHQNNVMGYGWTIEEFLKQEEYHNFQVRRICNEENLDKAISILETETDFVGITERFDESVLLMSYMMGEKFNPHYETRNTAKQRKDNHLRFKDFSPEIQKEITSVNELDEKLYQYVLDNIFPKYVASFQKKLEKDLTTFEARNKNFRYSKLTEGKIKLNHYYSTAIQKLMK